MKKILLGFLLCNTIFHAYSQTDPNYIQNQTTANQAASFRISGTAFINPTAAYTNAIRGLVITSNAMSGLITESTGSLNFGITGADASGFVFRWLSANSAAIDYSVSTNEIMRLTKGGNLGIGTTSPAYKLDVNGNARFLNALNVGAGVFYGDVNNLAFFHDGGYVWANKGNTATRMSLNASGNLAVAGTITTGGNLVWHAGNFNPGGYALRQNLITDTYFDNFTQGGGVFNKGTTTSIRSVNYLNVQGIALNHSGPGWTTQIVVPYANSDGDKIFFRKANGVSSWGNWQEFWHTGNFNPANYLPLTGGSLTGDVVIGTTPAQKNLDVNGIIKTRKIKVTQTDWADYVFDSSYQLASLQQVKKYITQNRHLPDVPSAATVSKEGVDIADNQVLLLKKIEELTLYIIKQEERIKQLEEKIK